LDTQQLQEITNNTLKEVRNYDIVTPEFFADTFYDKAIKINPDIDKNELKREGKDGILEKVLHIQKETQEQTIILKDNITLASKAIEDKDDKSLGEVKNNIDDLYKRIVQLEEQVYLDELTKVQNRKWLFEKVLENNHFKEDGALTFVDVDKFKVVNDTYGHVAGDKVLIIIAKLTTHLEGSKTIRYGGDEFITLSQKSDAKQQQQFFTTINSNLTKKDLHYREHSFKVGISFGSVDYKAGDSFQEVLEKVDKLMYEHKKARAELAEV